MEETYRERLARFQNETTGAAAESAKVSSRRGMVFFAAVVCGLLALYAPIPTTAAILLAVLAFALLVGFIFFVLLHRRIHEKLERARHFEELNRNALARLDREWEAFPVPAAPVEFENHPTARDLDLFGQGSLFQLINTCGTPGGRIRLAEWLVHPADPDVIPERQSAVAELAPQIDWRQELHFAGRELNHPSGAVISMPIRKAGESSFYDRPGLMLAIRIFPIVLLVLLVCHFIGLLPPLWLFVLLASVALNRVFARRMAAAIGDLRLEEHALQAYATIFEKLGELKAVAPWLARRYDRIEGAHEAVGQLCQYATSHAARGSIVYPFLKYGLLSEFHVAAGVEKWHARHRDQVEKWFDALAEMEAIASLAGLHHDEPAWVFPQGSAEKTIVSKDLGHPLIAGSARVCNDLTVDPPGRFLLVTGSNMSGKSTLLRSLGLNVVLAQAGAPVCASAFQHPPLHLVTNLRVEDSLTEGVSFFMAELQRIKSAVQLADDPPGGRVLLYLFDEILRGTNSVERQVIVQRLLGRLLQREAIGAITTHDLALAEVEELKVAARSVHFREEFVETPEGPGMTFDYQLREGLATTTNAVKLLEMMDLDL